MRRFPVAAVVIGGPLTVDPSVAHHLLDVIRVRKGERIVVFDGHGKEATAILADVVDGAPVLIADGPIVEKAPAHELHLLLALAKGPSMDLAVRMAVEAGATHLHPVITKRSIAKGERGDRWARIVESAAQQCGRADLTEIAVVEPLDRALESLPPGVDLRVAVPGAPRPSPAIGAAAVVIGPEGGLTDAEIAEVLRAGGHAIGLGRWVLRVETAVAVALALTAG